MSTLQQIFFFSLSPHQSSGQITPTAARNVYSAIARLSAKLMWLKQAQHHRHMQQSKWTTITRLNDVPRLIIHFRTASCTKFSRELGRVSIFSQLINWHHHMKDHVEIGHFTKYDAFRVNRDRVMDLDWLKIHTNVSNFLDSVFQNHINS